MRDKADEIHAVERHRRLRHRHDGGQHRHGRPPEPRRCRGTSLVVVGLALILLTIVFRSILVPIKAAVGFLLSIAAVAGPGGLDLPGRQPGRRCSASRRPGRSCRFLPILLIGILFGLAMDYEVFLVSRMREHFVHAGDAKAGRSSPASATAAGW